MPSSDWSTLVVKRNWLNIPVGRKSADGSSRSSACSSLYSSATPTLISRQFAPDTPAGSANTSGYYSALSSRAPSPVESECGYQGHKSLVPIGPFLAPGSAHTFSSFQTGRIESHRLSLIHSEFPSYAAGRSLSRLGGAEKKTDSVFCQSEEKIRSHSALDFLSLSTLPNKDRRKRSRRSLDSDSLSSTSAESISRPASPVVTDSADPKTKVRKIYVSSDTLDKIKNGDKKVLKNVIDINESLTLKIPTTDDEKISTDSNQVVSHSENDSFLEENSSDSFPESASSCENISPNSSVSQGYHTDPQESAKFEVRVDYSHSLKNPKFHSLLKNIAKNHEAAPFQASPRIETNSVGKPPFDKSHASHSEKSDIPASVQDISASVSDTPDTPRDPVIPVIEATPVFSAENLSAVEYKEKFSLISFANSPEIASHTKSVNFHIAAINAALAHNSGAVVIQPTEQFPNHS